MNISALFIMRPRGTSLLMTGILLLGCAAYILLPIAPLPQVEFPTVQVTASLPGASPEIMATSVTAPLERQLSVISGVTQMTSASALGRSSIAVQFDLNRSIDAAAQDVQAAINAAGGQLPKNLPNPPTYEKVNPADFTILSLAVSSDTLPISQVDVFADTYIAQQLSRIQGVGLVDLHGEQKPAVRVQVDPAKIAALGISLEQIRAVLGASTVNSPKGTLDGPQRSLSVDTTDQLSKANAYNDLVVAYHNGAPVRVRDIGQAIDGVEDVKQGAWVGDHRAVIVDVHKQPGYNVAGTVDAIKAALPGLLPALPASVSVQIVGDRTQTIRASVRDVEVTLLLTVALVVVVVFVFLRSFWATVIPAVAIPLSIIATFAAMYVLGYSLNNISLMGLTIAVGFVVDDAIVMIENITRHLEFGEDRLNAALKGSRQVFFTIISMTASLVAALIPLLLMGGIVGRFFREFSVTLAVALFMSAFVSLTLTPMMCRVFLKDGHSQIPSSWAQHAERLYLSMLDFYERSLGWALAYRGLTLGLSLAIAVLTGLLYWQIPKGFFPQQDTGLILGTVDASPDISAPAMMDGQLRVVRRLMDDPDIDNVYSWIGGGTAVNNGRVMINLKPFGARHYTAGQIMGVLREKTAGMPGLSFYMQPRQDLQVGGRISRTQFQYTLEDTNLSELYGWAQKLCDKFKTMPELRDVATDLEAAAPQTTIVIDRDMASRFGITPQAIDDTLYDALGQRQVATIFTELDQYHVVLELDPSYKMDKHSLEGIYVPSLSGRQVPLSVFANSKDTAVPLQVNHQGQFPAVTLSFNLAPGVALGDAVNLIGKTVGDLNVPPGLHGNFQGTAQAFQDSLRSQPYLIIAAIIAVYIVLGILYESYIHPVTILSTLPSAGLGALLVLLLSGYDLNVISLIGIILLIGIVKKNAIMMIDFAVEAEKLEGLDPEAAMRRACLLRFRPIMMTTMAAIFGGLPLAFGGGAGSELRAPLGVAIVGGLVVSQVLTLYTTPIIYLYFDKLTNKFKRWTF